MKIKRLELNAHMKFPQATPLIHIYFMTSFTNDKETQEHFAKNNYFGLHKEQVHFFCQGNIPIITYDGELVPLPSSDGIITTPNGNGGVYEALLRSGAYEEMKKNGIQWVHFLGIDNIMVKPADPIFVGLCAAENVELGNKAVTKVHRPIMIHFPFYLFISHILPLIFHI